MATKEYELQPGCAKHYCRDGTVVEPGDTVESEVDLAKKFPKKFREYGEQKTKTPKNRKKDDGPKDVSGDFENAEQAGVQVFKEGRKYVVTDSDGENLTEEPITKAAVANLIEERLEPEEE